jgi:membrane-bound serine protease (ClpP class)
MRSRSPVLERAAADEETVLLLAALVAAFLFVPSPWGFLLVVGAALLELAETAFWIRFSRRRRAQVGAETLIGAEAVVTEACVPLGQVRLVGELWQARCDEGADAGERVRVVGRDGLVLVVRPLSGGK